MNKLLLFILMGSLMACSKNSSSPYELTPNSASTEMLGRFEAVSTKTDTSSSDLSCLKVSKGIDPALKAGFSFKDVHLYKSFEDKVISVSNQEEFITSVDFNKQFFLSKTVFNSSNASAWITQKTQFAFDENSSSSHSEVLDSSLNLKKPIAEQKAKDKSKETWTTCHVKFDSDPIKYKSDTQSQIGFFILQNGKKLNAVYEKTTTWGTLECSTYGYESATSASTAPLSQIEIGPGTSTHISIRTDELPSRTTDPCGTMVYSKDENLNENSEVITISAEELVGGKF